MLKYHTVEAQTFNGRTLATAKVVSSELTRCFWQWSENRNVSMIFIDGKGYTSRKQYMEMVSAINKCSMQAGGARIF